MTEVPDEHGQLQGTWPVHPPTGGQPVPSDLRQAARTFGAQAAAFRSIMPAEGPASVDGGNREFDRALTQMLELIGALHAQLAATIALHGSNLDRACEKARERS